VTFPESTFTRPSSVETAQTIDPFTSTFFTTSFLHPLRTTTRRQRDFDHYLSWRRSKSRTVDLMRIFSLLQQVRSNHHSIMWCQTEFNSTVASSKANTMAGDDNMQGEITRLKNELALALQSRDNLQAQLKSLVTPNSRCCFLKDLPLKIRNEIYELLLTNPILGEPDSIAWGFGGLREYNLTPAILGTCQQINAEASSILYGVNTFFITCVKGDTGDRWGSGWNEYINPSPLTRYWNDGKTRNEYIQLEAISTFRKVRNWKVLCSRLGSPKSN
jgi:hypothetical protein